MAWDSSAALLEARDLTKEFRGIRALRGVSLEVAEGSVRAVVGTRGAGKTTLLNLLSGYLSPTSGAITFRGQDVTPRRPGELARLGIARSFRLTGLFSERSAVDHVELALASSAGLAPGFARSRAQLTHARSRALDVLGQVGLGDVSDVAVGALAAGQRRGLELALALAPSPGLLLLDEPTAGLGADDVDRTIALVRRLSEGRTVVLVEHNMHAVESLADSVTALDSGRVIAQGATDQVRSDDLVVPAHLGRPGGVVRPSP